MRRAFGSWLVACAVSLCPIVAAAQTPNPQSPSVNEPSLQALTPDQDRELARWLDAIEDWREYDARWFNRPARDRLGRATKRRQPPTPPAWLEGYCERAAALGLAAVDARIDIACRLRADPRARRESLPPEVEAARIQAEKPAKHSKFLTRVHLDGLWSTAATTGRFYGLIGSHLSLVDVGRVQIFGPPGVLLVSMPQPDGSRQVTLGYTWGVSVRLTDVRLFGTKDMTLFANVSKVWISGGAESGGTSRGYDMIGFSIAPRSTR
jgi:hypothetical protein